MKKTIIAAAVLLPAAIAISSCSDDNDGPQATGMRLASIAADTGNDKQTFEYDASGRVSQYTVVSGDCEVKARYTYPDNNTIEIKSTETVGENTTVYNETLIMESGIARSAVGSWTIIRPDGTISKDFTINFAYTANRLASIAFSEQMPGSSVPPMKWTNTLTWESDNLVEYNDLAGGSSAARRIVYKYTSMMTWQPVIALPLIRHHYTPLQIAGVFGTQPQYLAGQILYYTGDKLDYTRTYTYSLEENRVLLYTVIGGKEPVRFLVSWKTAY